MHNQVIHIIFTLAITMLAAVMLCENTDSYMTQNKKKSNGMEIECYRLLHIFNTDLKTALPHTF